VGGWIIQKWAKSLVVVFEEVVDHFLDRCVLIPEDYGK
jgi:hypothetical protein